MSGKKQPIIKAIKQNYLYLLLLLVMIVGSVMILWANTTMDANIAEAEEDVRPADVHLTVLVVPECSDCFNVSQIVSVIRDGPFNVVSQEEIFYDSELGAALIEKYNIVQLPNVIIRGELEKENVSEFLAEGTDQVEDVAIWSQIPPIYHDTETGEVVGRVSMTLITDNSCEECYDPNIHNSIISSNFGVNMSKITEVDRSSSEGRALIAQYDIKSVPTSILSKDATVYGALASAWPQIGTIEDDGAFVFRDLSVLRVVYMDLETGMLVELNDKN